jgi:serine protease
VTAGSASFTGSALEFAGRTSGTTGTLVDCGLGKVGQFPAGVAGNVALIQRGDISFADKVTNAMNAGAAAVVIYNNAAGDFTGTLGEAGSWIPAVSVSDTVGATLKASVGTSATVVNQASSWDHYDGTSMATPHVTGVVALIWSANSTLSNTTVESYLFATATDLGAAGYDTTYGRGLVNADAAVARTGR